ncbi:hypothetical protein KGP26_20445 [Serratia sp. JSRIV002]|nr:hypothetical protein KGP26_20445 [Serratia sp. JSRIV002]
MDGTQTGDGATPKPVDFDRMTKEERRDLRDRLKNQASERSPPPEPAHKPHIVTPEIVAGLDDFAVQVLAFVRSIGLEPTPWEFDALLSGAVVNFGPGHAFRLDGARLLPVG